MAGMPIRRYAVVSKNRILAFVLIAGMAGDSTAGEHPACLDIDFPYRDLSSTELKSIAISCDESTMAELYFQRARYAELAEDHAVMNRLERVQKNRTDWTVRQDRLFLTLVEVFTAQRDMPEGQRTEVLGRALEHAIAVSELRLRGYDLQAKRLEATGLRQE
jgi:hypothetical protein